MRVPLEIGCVEQVDRSWYFRMSADLSVTGLSIPSGPPREVGSKVLLRLQLPDDPELPLRVTGTVVAAYSRGVGLRLAFTEPSVEQVRRISNSLLIVADASGSA